MLTTGSIAEQSKRLPITTALLVSRFQKGSGYLRQNMFYDYFTSRGKIAVPQLELLFCLQAVTVATCDMIVVYLL